nr:immunoglobulin light chain junction region [Macaca mulatta]
DYYCSSYASTYTLF